ncbi:MAG: TonB-dependent receptor plug domain-containing protein, partial [Candidatus Deferrimicrobiaceae bacterium]
MEIQASIAIVLKPGKLAEEVTVTAPNPLIDKIRADNSFRFKGEELARIPTQSRTIEEIVSYVPGVTGVRSSTFNGTGTGLPSFRGEGEANNNWLVDGLSIRGSSINDLAVRVNYDAWDEVEIVSDGFAPEMGQATGGFINVVTKSGGNTFHGELGTLIRDWHLRADRQPQLSVVSEPDT